MRLGDVLTFEYGKPLPPNRRAGDGNVPVYGANGIKDWTNSAFRIEPTIIVGRKGSAGEIQLTDGPFWPLDVTYYVTFDRSRHNLRFLYYLLDCIDLRRLAKGIKPGINRNEAYGIPVSVPPLEEQRRIVAVLDEGFAAIATANANAEKNLANARELFDSAIKNALFVEDPDWKSAPFEECLDLIKYPAKVQRKAFLAEGAYPVISQEASFINGYWDDPQDLLRVPRPLVVFGDHTQVLKYIDFDFVLGADGVKLLLPRPEISGRFLYYFLKANPVPSAGYARHYRYLKSLTLRFPSLADQNAITSRRDEIDAATDEFERLICSKIEKLSALKRSILHDAFSGELTEREPLAA
jgi:type I restriction enzyme, S subunit